MNKLALAAALALTIGSAAQAKLIELVPEAAGAVPPAQARVAPAATTLPLSGMSELPEPEVFAMMLVGLILVGYKVRRDSSEKFE